MIFGKEVACWAGPLNRLCSGKYMWPKIHIKARRVFVSVKRVKDQDGALGDWIG